MPGMRRGDEHDGDEDGAAVAADGSPVPVYLALPPGYAPELIHNVVGEGGRVLELGCGAGRVTRPLLARGHPVVAVDSSPAMLAHVTGAETVLADVRELDLGRTFDGVVAGSHLINDPDPRSRRALLATCGRHAAPGGVVLLERYPPRWAGDPRDRSGRIGDVEYSYQVTGRSDGTFDGVVVYRLGGREWRQPVAAVALGDDQLAAEAAGCGLALERTLGVGGAWVRLRPGRSSHRRTAASEAARLAPRAGGT